MVPTPTDAQPPKTSRRVALWIVIVAVLIAAVFIIVFREPNPPEVVLLPSNATIQSNPLPDRWIPRTWGWMWRLRDSIMGRRTMVDFQAQLFRFSDAEDLKHLPAPALATNGLKVWNLNVAQFQAASASLNASEEKKAASHRSRVNTGDGNVATIFSGNSVPLVGGGFTDVGFQLQILPRTHKRKTDVTFNVRSTEMVASPPSSDAGATSPFPSIRTNLLQAARVQVPIGNGLLLMQVPSADHPGVVLLLSVGRK